MTFSTLMQTHLNLRAKESAEFVLRVRLIADISKKLLKKEVPEEYIYLVLNFLYATHYKL